MLYSICLVGRPHLPAWSGPARPLQVVAPGHWADSTGWLFIFGFFNILGRPLLSVIALTAVWLNYLAFAAATVAAITMIGIAEVALFVIVASLYGI